MATREEAKAAWQRTIGQYRKLPRKRVVFLGDGQGYSASNLFTTPDQQYVLARSSLESNDFFPVRGARNVQPSFNLPVTVTLEDGDPYERIDDIVQIFGSYSGSTNLNTNVGLHHEQHQYGGGDEVYIEPELFLPGLVAPTNPPSMKVRIFPFVYYWKEWRLFPFTESEDLTQYLPSQNSRWVVLTLDQIEHTVRYNIGYEFINTATIVQILEGRGAGYIFQPPPPGNELPLAAVLLQADTTTIDWQVASGTNNIVQLRMFNSPPSIHMLERIEQLERLTGNPPNLSMMGAAETTVDERNIVVIDGGDLGGY